MAEMDEPGYESGTAGERVTARRDDLETALRAAGVNLLEPPDLGGIDRIFPRATPEGGATLVQDWTCGSLLGMADAFFTEAQLASAAGDQYHFEQYYHAGSAFYDAWRAQCPH